MRPPGATVIAIWLLVLATSLSAALALPVAPPAYQSGDVVYVLAPEESQQPACNAACVQSLLKKTSYASGAVGVMLTMSEYNSIDWCMSATNVGWCPPTVGAVLDRIATVVSSKVQTNDSKTDDCGPDCLQRNLEAVSRRAAAVGMLWAKHKVAGEISSSSGSGAPDTIDWSIYLLAGNVSMTEEIAEGIDAKAKRSLNVTSPQTSVTVQQDVSPSPPPSPGI